MKYSIKQISKNLPRLLMVGIIVMLAYLVLSFISTIFIEHGLSTLSPRLGFDYTHIYEIKINWNSSFTDDEQLYYLKREELEQKLLREQFVEKASYAAKSVIDDPEYYAYTREWGIIGVDDNFMTTIGHEVLNGRDFIKDDLDYAYPAAILPQSAAKAHGITSTGDDVLLKMTYNKKDITFRVVGIVKDLEFNSWTKVQYPIFVFVNRYHNNLWINAQSDWIYLHTNQGLANSEVKNRLKTLFENEGYSEQMLELEVRNQSDVLKAKLISKLKEFKPLLAIMLLLVIYISTTLFGIFHKHVQKKKEEFAIRRALGCQRSGIYKKIIQDGLIMASPGIILGGLLYLNFLFLQNQLDLWISSILPAVIIVMVILLSVAWPAIKAGGVTPVDGLREA